MEQGSFNSVRNMGHKGPVLRPRCIGLGRARTQIPFYFYFYEMEVNSQFHTLLFYNRRKEKRRHLNSRLVAPWRLSEPVGRTTVTGFCLASKP